MQNHQEVYGYYMAYLRKINGRDVQTCLKEFMLIISRYGQSNYQFQHKYAKIHIAFLIQTIATVCYEQVHLFSTLLLLLNFILKIEFSLKIKPKSQFFRALKHVMLKISGNKNYSLLLSNILWLICRLLKDNVNQRAIINFLQKHQIISICLTSFQLNCYQQKIVSALTCLLLKDRKNNTQLANLLISNFHKFNHSESLKQVLTAIRELDFQNLAKNTTIVKKLGTFFQSFMKRSDIGQSQRRLNDHLLIKIGLVFPEMIQSLDLAQIIQNKIKSNQINISEENLKDIISIITILGNQLEDIRGFLDLAVETLTFNSISRRIFIVFHERLSDRQLMNIMKSNLPKILTCLLICQEQMQNCLKLIICTKRAVLRLGLNRIFWYSFKELIENILYCKSLELPISSIQLFQLFQQVMAEEIERINVQ